MMTQAQWILLLCLVNAILGALFITSLQTLNKLKKEIHRVYQAKIEFYIVDLWEKLLKELKNIEQFSATGLSNEELVQIQREFGALEQKVHSATGCLNRASAIYYAFEHINYLLTENNLSGGGLIKKVEQVEAHIVKLREWLKVDKKSRIKLLYIAEENNEYVKIHNASIDIIKSIFTD